jgi:nucleotide-binding universal stress UspA family protein
MRKMLAFIDGSIYSDSVCDHVIWAAAGDQFDVSLFNVIEGARDADVPSNFSGSLSAEAKNKLLSELSELDQKRAKLAQKKGRLVLDLARKRLVKGGLKKVETHLRNGDFVSTVTDYQDDSDLIIIGKRGEDADFAKLHLGSNLERLIRSTNKPVLVAARSFKPIKKLLVAFDGGRSSYGAIDYIASNKSYSELDCHIVIAGEEGSRGHKQAIHAENLLKKASVDYSVFYERGEPEKVISDHVEKYGVDLLVMGAYGHSKIRNLIIGSTTTQMIRSCLVPVLLFR